MMFRKTLLVVGFLMAGVVMSVQHSNECIPGRLASPEEADALSGGCIVTMLVPCGSAACTSTQCTNVGTALAGTTLLNKTCEAGCVAYYRGNCAGS